MKRFLLILITLGTVSCNMKKMSHDDHQVTSKRDTADLMSLYPELAERIDKNETTPLNNYFKLTTDYSPMGK